MQSYVLLIIATTIFVLLLVLFALSHDRSKNTEYEETRRRRRAIRKGRDEENGAEEFLVNGRNYAAQMKQIDRQLSRPQQAHIS